MTIPDATAADALFAVAEESVAILRKRDGTEMTEVFVARCNPTWSEPNENAMIVAVGLEETQVREPAGEKVEAGRTSLISSADEAASKAAEEGLAQTARMPKRGEQRLADRLASDSDRGTNVRWNVWTML